MRGMILAAGRGKRMQELTAHVPKPLLKVANRYLIEHAIDSLVKNGICDIVINICYQREQIKSVLGDGARYGANFYYSEEEVALETGGGIFQALPLLGKMPFIVLSCDVITDYPLKKLPQEPTGLAHLVLVSNPSYHSTGDFYLEGENISLSGSHALTFGNIGIYRPELFAECKPGKFALGPLLKSAVATSQITGEYYQGVWHNVGTPEQLKDVVRSDKYVF